MQVRASRALRSIQLVYGLAPNTARSVPTIRPGLCTPRLVPDKSVRDFVKSGLTPRLVLDKTALSFVRPVER